MMNPINCGDPLLDSALRLKLPAGKYRIQARNEQGGIIMKSNMEFGKNGSSSSSSGAYGYFRMNISGNCLQVWGDKLQ